MGGLQYAQTMPRKVQAPKVTEKNTKSEIFDAYQELLKELESEPERFDGQIQETRIVEAAKEETVKKILDDLSNLKLTSNQAISSLTDKLAQEAERLTTFQKAIEISQKELEELYQIKSRAGMLKQMLELQKRREEEFETEMKRRRFEWDEEQSAYAEKLKRERSRTEEEYQYQLKMKKLRDMDEWSEELRKHERTLKEEKEVRVQMETELADLRKQVASFATELDNAVKEAVTRTIAEQKKEAQIAQNFAKQEAQAVERIAALKIASFEATVKSQSQEIAELKRQLENATRQVKDIAVSVIESSKKDSTTQQLSPQK